VLFRSAEMFEVVNGFLDNLRKGRQPARPKSKR